MLLQKYVKDELNMAKQNNHVKTLFAAILAVGLSFLVVLASGAFDPFKNLQTTPSVGIILTTNPEGDPNDFSLNAFVFKGVRQVSSTGWNSSQTRLGYNPQTESVFISWLDYYTPFTSNAKTTLFYSYGNKTVTDWSANVYQVKNMNGTILSGINPSVDFDNTVHFITSDMPSNNYDLNETLFIDEAVKQAETPLIVNTGNSTLPITITDHKGFIHLVWRDTTDNINGDLYYTFYNATTGSWNASYSKITTAAAVVENSSLTIAIDENNTLHLVWADKRSAEQELYYSYLEENGSWSTEEKITTVAYSPLNPKMAYDTHSKKLLLLFRDTGTSNNLYYLSAPAKAQAIDWSTPQAISNYLAKNGDFDLCTDTYGNAILVFERNDGVRNNIYLRYKSSNATNWGPLEIVSNLATPAYDPSIIVADDGTVYMAYTELLNGKTEVFIRYGILDSDGDGLSDLDEINIYGTDPYAMDSDGDTLSDGDEILIYNTNPLSSDTDNDQMPDNFEINYSFDPLNASDASLDVDQDNLTNLEEFTIETNPLALDTDLDFLSDGQEHLTYHTNPLNPDTDGDGLLDGYETTFGLNPLIADDINEDIDHDGLTTEFESIIWTDPTNPDTDGDGVTDGQEVADGTDPLDPTDYKATEPTRNNRNIIIGILVAVGAVSVFLLFAIVVARQFKPKKSLQRKELEREEAHFSEKVGAKATKPRFEFQKPTPRTKEITELPETTREEPPLQEEKIKEVKVSEPSKEPSPPVDEQLLLKKKNALRQAITALQNYEEALRKMLKKDLTPFNVSTITREALTEFAADSQALLGEAKTTWSATILPLIKGFEEQLLADTLEAEKILDNCKTISDKILEILVAREMEIVDEEEKREEIKRKAQEALKSEALPSEGEGEENKVAKNEPTSEQNKKEEE